VTASIVLEAITVELRPVLDNLFQLYVHDFSELLPLELAPSGRFEPPLDDIWWARDDHFPFLIREHGHLRGFALVRRGSRVDAQPDVMDVAEFFVVRGARGKGVGAAAAHALFAAFPGAWQVRVRDSNPLALRFWRRTIEAWLGQAVSPVPFSAKGAAWQLLAVSERAPGAP
jgi:predicted acetyltransferase